MQDQNSTYVDYQNLFNLFDNIYPLKDEIRKSIIASSEVINVGKKVKLLSFGERSDTIYFINKGAARVYYLNRDGKELTRGFYLKTNCSFPFIAFIQVNRVLNI